jgi:hypothetical protein
VVFAAVAVELAPILLSSPKSQLWVICVGFFVGVCGFLVLGAVLPEPDECEDEEATSPRCSRNFSSEYRQQKRSSTGLIRGIQRGVSKRRSIKQQLRQSALITFKRPLSFSQNVGYSSSDWNTTGVMKTATPATCDSADGDDSFSAEAKAGATALESPPPGKNTQSSSHVCPVAFAVAVGVDALVDGFLIGITSVSSNYPLLLF